MISSDSRVHERFQGVLGQAGQGRREDGEGTHEHARTREREQRTRDRLLRDRAARTEDAEMRGAKGVLERLGWRLMRGGRTYSHGRPKNGRLNLDLSNLRPGRYVLRINGKRNGTTIVVG